MQNLNELLKLLLEAKIEFVIVGGFAGVVHGASQVTQDLDICLVVDKEQVKKLRSCFKHINPRHRMVPQKPSFLDTPDDPSGLKNVYLETDLGVLDLMSEVPNIGDFKRVLEKSISVELFGHTCKVIGLDDLIEVKKNLTRSKDKALYHELIELKNQIKN